MSATPVHASPAGLMSVVRVQAGSMSVVHDPGVVRRPLPVLMSLGHRGAARHAGDPTSAAEPAGSGLADAAQEVLVDLEVLRLGVLLRHHWRERIAVLAL